MVHIGEIDRVGDFACFHELTNFLTGHLGTVELGFGCRTADMWENGDTVLIEKVLASKVGNITFDHARLNGFKKVLMVDQFTPSKVDDGGALIHQGKSLSIKGLTGSIRQGHVNGNVVGIGKDFLDVLHPFDMVGNIPGCFNRDIGVVTHNRHT